MHSLACDNTCSADMLLAMQACMYDDQYAIHCCITCVMQGTACRSLLLHMLMTHQKAYKVNLLTT